MSAIRAQIRALLEDGLSIAEVARRLGLAYTTVTYHRDRPLGQTPTARKPAASDLPDDDAVVPINTRGEVHRLLSAGRSRAEVARTLGISKSTVTYHAGRLGMAIDTRAARRYDWNAVQRYYSAGHTMEQCRARYGFSKAAWTGAVRRGDIVARDRAMPIEALLSAPRGRHNLKRRLLKAGLLEPVCGGCGLQRWRGAPLALQLHHVNGRRHDNRLENLELLCPNCHSQTETWAGRNGTRGARRERTASGAPG